MKPARAAGVAAPRKLGRIGVPEVRTSRAIRKPRFAELRKPGHPAMAAIWQGPLHGPCQIEDFSNVDDLRGRVEHGDVHHDKKGTIKVDVDDELNAVVRSPVLAVRTDVRNPDVGVT